MWGLLSFALFVFPGQTRQNIPTTQKNLIHLAESRQVRARKEQMAQIIRARFAVDLLYEADKPLSGTQLTMVANRLGTYLRTGGVEDLEHKIKVRFDEELRHQRSHHHDARFNSCRACVSLGQDNLGVIEE